MNSKFIRLVKSRPLLIMCSIVILIFIIMAVFADFIAPYSPTATDFSNPMSAPSAEHIFGTDRLHCHPYSQPCQEVSQTAL